MQSPFRSNLEEFNLLCTSSVLISSIFLSHDQSFILVIVAIGDRFYTKKMILINPISADARNINARMEVAGLLLYSEPKAALKMISDINHHERLHRVRGWAYLVLGKHEDAIREFEKGYEEGDISCLVYAHRELRESGRNPKKFAEMEELLYPYFAERNIQLMYAQSVLSMQKMDVNGAITNAITILSSSENQPTFNGYGVTFFKFFTHLIDYLADQRSDNREEASDEELFDIWGDALDFFANELRTLEGGSLNWNPLFYFFSVSDYIEREMAEEKFGSAYILPEFIPFYREMLDYFEPPKRPKVLSDEEIWQSLLRAIDSGSFISLPVAREFAESYGFDHSLLAPYEKEMHKWGLAKHLA
jgi:hypothetical protein